MTPPDQLSVPCSALPYCRYTPVAEFCTDCARAGRLGNTGASNMTNVLAICSFFMAKILPVVGLWGVTDLLKGLNFLRSVEMNLDLCE